MGMSEFDNTNRGSIWKNDRKEQDTHADFTGSINVEGVDYFLNGWLRKEGAHPKAPSMSFSIKRKDKQTETVQPHPQAAMPQQQTNGFEDSDIPF
jgi:hypothetical protein